MKKTTAFKFLLLTVLLFAFASYNSAYSQTAREKKKMEEAAKLKMSVDSMHFVFRVQSVLPSNGSTDIASDGYQVIVTIGKIDSYLPYFGNTFSSNYDKSAADPLQFTSTSFSFSVVETKKGVWDVTLATKDMSEPKTLLFTIFENGSAVLHVNSNNRQPISFNGYVMPYKEKKN